MTITHEWGTPPGGDVGEHGAGKQRHYYTPTEPARRFRSIVVALLACAMPGTFPSP